MNPTVQVALVSVIATLITTMGVVVVAIIENRKELVKTRKMVESGIMPGYDEGSLNEVLERLLSVMEENEKKEIALIKLRKQNYTLRRQIKSLQAQLQDKENDVN
jgi:flagellar motor component MotA